WPTDRSPSSSSSRIWSLVGSPRTLKKRAAAAALAGARTEYISGKQDIMCTGRLGRVQRDFRQEKPECPATPQLTGTPTRSHRRPPPPHCQATRPSSRGHRAMLAGRPAEVAAIAASAAWTRNEAAARLRDWPGACYDEDGRVVGFAGIAAAPITTHLVTTEAGSSWAWCVLDPLIILPLLNERGRVAARSGITGTPGELVVTPDSGTPVTAGGEEVYVSFLTPTGPFTSEVRQTCRDYVLFFYGRHNAERWTSEHPGTTALPLDEA